MKVRLGTIIVIAVLALEAAAARPIPRPALAARLAEGPEIIGIVHWGLNTFTDREWGFGNEDPAMLNPAKFDADQIVGACKAGGIGGLVVVAKHHDGFCLWPTKTTEHNITKSPFRGGKGDYVKEMEQACRRAGLKFGVYCSPWDRNNADYGTEKYVETYRAQLKELLSGAYGEIFEMWFDSANGGTGWYGGANERRNIGDNYYGLDDLFRLVRGLQPGVCIFNEYDAADFRFSGSESGRIDDDCRGTSPHFDRHADYKVFMRWAGRGSIEGVAFKPPECDFPLRKGWFFHESERGITKSGLYLMQRYLNNVGNGGTMNLGIAPDKYGLLDEEDVKALADFGKYRAAFFEKPVANGMCNMVVMREDVSKCGEACVGWRLFDGDTMVLTGMSIGVKRIRLLDKPCLAENLRLEVDGDESNPRIAGTYFVDPELVKSVLAATTKAGEPTLPEDPVPVVDNKANKKGNQE